MVHNNPQAAPKEEQLMSKIDQLSNCHPVAEAHWFMERTAFLERRSMEILAAWIWNTPHLDSKLSFGLHAYEDATQAASHEEKQAQRQQRTIHPIHEDWDILPARPALRVQSR